MKHYISFASNTIERWAQRFAALFLGLLVGLVLLQVVARYVFNNPPIWTEELSRYAMIWAGLLGATMSFKQRFDPALVQNRSSRRVITVIRKVISSAAVLIYLLPILWYCAFGPNMNVLRGFLYRHAKTSADTLDFPTLFVAVAVPIAVLAILVHLAARWVDGVNTNGE